MLTCCNTTFRRNHSLTDTLKTVFHILLLSVLLLWTQAATAQETASGDHVTVRWLAPDTFEAGKTETIGFHFEVAPEWHVYWRNAGDSGAAPRFAVKATGATTGTVQWPFPTRLPIAHLTNLGYPGNVVYLLPVTPAAGAGQLSLKVDLEWLVCKVDCIPGFGQMTLERPVAATSNWQQDDLSLRDHFLGRTPQSQTNSPWQLAGLQTLGETQFRLTLKATDKAEKAVAPEVFPLSGDLITAAQPQVEQTGEGIHYTFERVPGAELGSDATTGFVINHDGQAWQAEQVPFNTTPPAAVTTPTQPLWLLLLAAFAGGIVLNLMPCVFPVLSIKLLSLVQARPAQRLHEALAYSAGVLLTFAALGGLLLLLRATGSAIGWGFQLQSAPVILTLIALFWLMALSFSGYFDFGHRLMTLAGDQRGGAFITGILAVFVATPCTGPFMGVALGAAAVLPAASALAIFLGLGAGLAAPFVVLSLSPGLLKRLPKPGAWMDTLRQLMAFPLYITVIWLLWVLGQLTGDTGWLIGSLLMLALVLAIWLSRTTSRYSHRMAAAVAVLALVAAFSALRVTEPESAQTNVAGSAWQSFDPAVVAEARANQQAVFIDYTAAWCITCQVNKKLVLDTEPVQALFKQHNVLLMRADWTHHDPVITEALAALGRNSLPVYAWYAAGEPKAELLPQILQARMIRDLFE
uniref:Cytochrome c-type biogenesis protein DsbD, protein-disulfide reductase (EC) n=1 Tax=uncultured Thiotrichaceae bacterium TaxID=298394 RepID=A0A6S6UC12_9GAMM|nr:MAG: Cytochrome c-type biogenesis protein DsbD, protein-disulfide reductase (EC [uncultured Thiotrichaceae bacterium]